MISLKHDVNVSNTKFLSISIHVFLNLVYYLLLEAKSNRITREFFLSLFDPSLNLALVWFDMHSVISGSNCILIPLYNTIMHVLGCFMYEGYKQKY